MMTSWEDDKLGKRGDEFVNEVEMTVIDADELALLRADAEVGRLLAGIPVGWGWAIDGSAAKDDEGDVFHICTIHSLDGTRYRGTGATRLDALRAAVEAMEGKP